MSFIWDLYQQYQIEQLNQQVDGIRDSTSELAGSPDVHAASRLEDKVDRLALVCHAMFDIIAEKVGITEDELKARMKALDGADGQGDGRAVSAPHRCAKCGAMVPPGMDRCQFCGARDDAASAFG